MSKIRNRCVKTLPHELSTALSDFIKNKIKTNDQDVDYFGENVQDVNATSPYMPFSKETGSSQSFSAISNSDVDSITLDLNKLSGLSSSSSLSWSDEYESQTTKKVQAELERMDRVLRREDPIPFDYDKDEYEQWMNTFPNLSIFDTDITPVNSTQNIHKLLEEEEQLVVYGSEKYSLLGKGCDMCHISSSTNRKKTTVADNVMNMLTNQRSANTARKRKLEDNKSRNRNVFMISHKPRSLDTDNYLKISPIRNQTCERGLSSKYFIANRESSKDYPDTLSEFNSLPFIKVEDAENQRNTCSSRSKARKNSNKEFLRKHDEGHVVLPPIITSNQFRSISATPRKGNKVVSALSMKFDANFKREKSRKRASIFMEDTISNR